MTAVQTAPPITGYIPGTWAIDPTHSEVGFSVRHLMVSKVKGKFTEFSGTFVTGENPLDSSVDATVVLSSVDTGTPTATPTSARPTSSRSTSTPPSPTGRRASGSTATTSWSTASSRSRGVTREVPLKLEIHGFQPTTPFGDTRAGFTATAEIDRRDFGVSFNMALEGGGVGLGNKVQITLEVEAILQAEATS